jgi:hypothetical protein
MYEFVAAGLSARVMVLGNFPYLLIGTVRGGKDRYWKWKKKNQGEKAEGELYTLNRGFGIVVDII